MLMTGRPRPRKTVYAAGPLSTQCAAERVQGQVPLITPAVPDRARTERVPAAWSFAVPRQRTPGRPLRVGSDPEASGVTWTDLGTGYAVLGPGCASTGPWRHRIACEGDKRDVRPFTTS